MDHWGHVHISIAGPARFDMRNQARRILVTAFGQMHLVPHPPGGQLAPIGGFYIIGRADHFRWGRNVVIGTEVRLALDPFKLLHPDAPQDLDRRDML